MQLYLRDRAASITRPVKALKDWKRIELAPGESREVRFGIGADALSFPDARGDLRLEPGEFEVFVGRDSTVRDSVVLNVTE